MTRRMMPSYPIRFGEYSALLTRRELQLLGGRFSLRATVPLCSDWWDAAYAGLPRHRLPAAPPRLRVRLLLSAREQVRKRGEPPPLSMLSGAEFLGGATNSSNFVVLSPSQGSGLVVVSREMLRYPYHTRYEYIEFAVFTLASRCQRLVSLHAACMGRSGRGILLMGPSGSGKSTVGFVLSIEGLRLRVGGQRVCHAGHDACERASQIFCMCARNLCAGSNERRTQR